MNRSFSRIAAVAVGTLLFFVCGRYFSIPGPVANTIITLQYGVLAFLAARFGPLAGTLTGFAGHTLIDAAGGGPIWWSWAAASALFGALMGFGTHRMRLAEGICSKKDVVRFNMTQVFSHLLSWGICAPVLDVIIYNEPFERLVPEGLASGVANAVTTAVVGTVLCLAYTRLLPPVRESKTRP